MPAGLLTNACEGSKAATGFKIVNRKAWTPPGADDEASPARRVDKRGINGACREINGRRIKGGKVIIIKSSG